MRLRARAARERRARLEAETIAERFARDALHDPLTGLANRAFLLDRLELALARAERLESRVGLLFLDLDGFKTVNDTLGHGAGDRLLIEIARRLRSVVRSTDLVARLGGDEFLLLCEDVRDEAALTTLADAVAAATATPWLLDGTRVAVTTSIGVRLAVGGERADVVLRDADVAMYEAKTSGRSRWVVFDTVIRTRAAARADLEADLRRGIGKAELVAWYQPVVNLQTGEVTGAQALVRWQHPSRGLLTPDAFILAAEECGLIGQLGKHMLATASHQAVAWGYPQVGRMMHVNTTARELSTDGFPATVSSILAAAGLPARFLCLEITERQLVGEDPVVQRNLEKLRGLGVALAIDDFGTEYASFSYLRRLPVDVLKIDRSLSPTSQWQRGTRRSWSGSSLWHAHLGYARLPRGWKRWSRRARCARLASTRRRGGCSGDPATLRSGHSLVLRILAWWAPPAPSGRHESPGPRSVLKAASREGSAAREVICGTPCSAARCPCRTPHGPRRRWTTDIPASRAPTTSLSMRSPT